MNGWLTRRTHSMFTHNQTGKTSLLAHVKNYPRHIHVSFTHNSSLFDSISSISSHTLDTSSMTFIWMIKFFQTSVRQNPHGLKNAFLSAKTFPNVDFGENYSAKIQPSGKQPADTASEMLSFFNLTSKMVRPLVCMI